MDAGAPKDQANKIGWTALHEACFYNRAEVAKTLLLAGANATIRTRMGALPYHFAGLEMVRTMLKDIGGPDAVPEPGDKIDMVQVLQELTMSETSIVSGADGRYCETRLLLAHSVVAVHLAVDLAIDLAVDVDVTYWYYLKSF